MAERVGKDRASIANSLRLLRLPPFVRALVQDGTLGMGHARALLALEEPAAIEGAARQVRDRALSVRATEELVRRARAPRPTARRVAEKSASVRDVENRLTRALGARVVLHDRGGNRGGSIEIRYANLDDLDRILDRLEPG
jgi:ParB family transcriptional regulator, chromosome partitioning protein